MMEVLDVSTTTRRIRPAQQREWNLRMGLRKTYRAKSCNLLDTLFITDDFISWRTLLSKPKYPTKDKSEERQSLTRNSTNIRVS